MCSRGLKKWEKVFKNEPSKIYGRQPLKNLKWYGLSICSLSILFKGCLPQTLFDQFLNTCFLQSSNSFIIEFYNL